MSLVFLIVSISLACYFLLDESKQDKKRKKKKKKRNAAIVSIEEDDDSPQVTTEYAKDFPLDDSTVEETFKTNSASFKTSTVGHNRSSSYPGNITVVAEGTTEKKSRVSGQEILFTEVTKSISLPDNSVAVENIAVDTPKATKTSSFDLEDFLENVTSEPRYGTMGEGVKVQEATAGDDRDNFVFDAAGLFPNQPKVDSRERDVLQFQNAKESDKDKEMSSAASTVSELKTTTTAESVRQIQGDFRSNESDILQRQNVSEGENFGGRFSSTKAYYSQEKEILPRLDQSLDSFPVYRLAENWSSNESNSSMVQTQVPTVVEKTTSVTKLANESQGSTPVHLDNLHKSKVGVGEDFFSAQESYDLRQSPSGKKFYQERTENSEELDEDRRASGVYDYEADTSAESQLGTNDSTVEPVVLLDSGEPLVPLAEGGETAKTGAQSAFHYAPDVSAENDQDSASVSRSVRRSECDIEVSSEIYVKFTSICWPLIGNTTLFSRSQSIPSYNKPDEGFQVSIIPLELFLDVLPRVR